jgi:hypothetical protein
MSPMIGMIRSPSPNGGTGVGRSWCTERRRAGKDWFAAQLAEVSPLADKSSVNFPVARMRRARLEERRT